MENNYNKKKRKLAWLRALQRVLVVVALAPVTAMLILGVIEIASDYFPSLTQLLNLTKAVASHFEVVFLVNIGLGILLLYVYSKAHQMNEELIRLELDGSTAETSTQALPQQPAAPAGYPGYLPPYYPTAQDIEDYKFREKVEPLRKRSLAFGIISLVSLAISIAGPAFPPLFVFFALSIVFLIFGAAGEKKYRVQVSEYLIRGILEKGFTDLDYDPSKGSDFSGRYKGRKVTFSEYVVQDKGRFIRLFCDFGKPVPVRLELRERSGVDSVNDIRTKSDIETENIAFNKKFQIITREPHNAFYILTPHFMERILSMDKTAHGKTSLVFEGSSVCITIQSDMTMLRINTVSDELKNINRLRERYRQDLFYLTSIVDVLLENEYLA